MVLAKPAEQTPLVAAEAVRVLWSAGVPRSALQLLPGDGAVVGAALVADPRVMGVMFTGSTEVARLLQRSIVGRVDASGQAIPLIAETGGQNAMIVDSSALAEQVVADVLASGFDSAGQRCSALRVLCVQEDVADTLLDMLKGAMDELAVGDPARLATDVGPVIDAEAREGITGHIDAMRAKGRRIHQTAMDPALSAQGHFVPPTLVEIDGIPELGREVFGPVVHVVRYRADRVNALVAAINATGYGLTMGLHSRIDGLVSELAAQANAGNLYINRNMVGAVVGVQPFGGEGLSGTGPKAGGPLYLHRLLRQRGEVLARAFEHAADAPVTPVTATATAAALHSLATWSEGRHPAVAGYARRLAASAFTGRELLLPGPTGEQNTWRIAARQGVLCLGDDDDVLLQLSAVLALDGNAVWPMAQSGLHATLPAPVRARVALDDDALASQPFDAVLLHGPVDALVRMQQLLAQRDGPIIPVVRLDPGGTDIPLERLVVERVMSVNTAAAGGNASLLAID